MTTPTTKMMMRTISVTLICTYMGEASIGKCYRFTQIDLVFLPLFSCPKYLNFVEIFWRVPIAKKVSNLLVVFPVKIRFIKPFFEFSQFARDFGLKFLVYKHCKLSETRTHSLNSTENAYEHANSHHSYSVSIPINFMNVAITYAHTHKYNYHTVIFRISYFA